MWISVYKARYPYFPDMLLVNTDKQIDCDNLSIEQGFHILNTTVLSRLKMWILVYIIIIAIYPHFEVSTSF